MSNMTTALTARFARTRRLLAVCALALMASAWAPVTSNAAMDLTSYEPFSLSNARTPDPTRAGSHPTLQFNFTTKTSGDPELAEEAIKRLLTELPEGLVINPRAATYCPPDDYAVTHRGCPLSSNIGVASAQRAPGMGIALRFHALKPKPGEAGRIGIKANGAVPGGQLVASITPSNGYRVRTLIEEMNREFAFFYAIKFATFWGTPADHNNSGAPKRAAVTYTPNCSADMTTTLTADSYQFPDVFDTISAAFPTPSGCESVPFTPAIDVEPSSSQPGAPSAYTVDLTVPETFDPNELGQAHLKDAVVTLPEGVTLNPSAADGLTACTNAQVGLKSDAASACPEEAKIGTVSVESLALDQPVKGSIYVGSQVPGDPYRIFLVIGRDNLLIKLKGSISLDPQSGRLTTTFKDNPQLPFSKMSLTFKDGPRAPLANPTTCGEKKVTSILTPWSGNAAAEPSDTFTIDCPATAGFTPTFDAGMVSVAGGSFSPFVLRIDRDDADQMLSGVSIDMPEGLLAKIQGVDQCADAQAASGACGPGSRVGTATVGAGAGSPFFLNGPVYLTGPYKGAPFGLAVVVRAVAGPYDLGTVVVRQALHVDSGDASVKAVSDPLPAILEGVPLRLRSINVDMDRPGFMVNPTSCGSKRIAGTLSSTAGASADVAAPFRARDCRDLAFEPKLALRLTGKRQRKPGSHPGLRAVLTQRGGQANLDRVRVELPKSLALDPDNANGLCSYEDGLKADCPASSVIGTATAHSPLVNRPLSGPVHFVQGVRFDKETGNRIRTTPTLLVKLRGEIAIDLRATTTASGGRLVTTFADIPDAAVSRFNMRLRGGKGGVLAVTGERNLCSTSREALVETDGQNGRRHDFVARMKSPCRR
jgi:hypothetical protein